MTADCDNILQHELAKFLQQQAFDIHQHYNPAYLCYNVRLPILDKIAIHFGDISNISMSDLISRVRNYVHLARGIGEEVRHTDSYKCPTRQIPHILHAIWRYHENKSKVGVDMFCQATMLAMGVILQMFGVSSRETSIISTTYDRTKQNIGSHAVLEVWNQDEKRWELHDPIGDIAYATITHKNDSFRPVSAMEFFSFSQEELTFISHDDNYTWPASKRSDWSHERKNEHAQFYISMFSDIVVSRYLSHGPIGMLNLNKVDLTEKFPRQNNRNIVEFLNLLYAYGDSQPVLQGWYTQNEKMSAVTLPPLKDKFEFCEFYPELAKELGYPRGGGN